MKVKYLLLVITLALGLFLITPYSEDEKISNTIAIIEPNGAIIADHTVVDYLRLDLIPDENITNAKDKLHIAYQGTSHASQLTWGLIELDNFKEGLGGTVGLYDCTNADVDGYLDFDWSFASGDLGNPDRTTWESLTRSYLDDSSNSDVNVVMWSWCGQVDYATEADINTYLTLMDGLETDYPNVTFVYMTGHVMPSGLTGNNHLRNEQIRDYVRANGKVLFDFADIESYDPDGNYYGDKNVTDGCCYDLDGSGTTEYTGDPETPIGGDANWAQDWQNNHTEDVDWYSCSSSHTEPLNANMKAYAAWWLFATLAGYNSTAIPTSTPTPTPTTPTPSPTPTDTDSPTPSTTPSPTTTPPNSTLSLTNPSFTLGTIGIALTSASIFVTIVVVIVIRKKKQ